MQSWGPFFEILCGTAATLIGLLFVAVSVNARAILADSHKHSRRLAEQAFQNYLAVLVVGLMALYPNMGQRPLGVSLLLMATVWSGWVVARLYQTLQAKENRADTLRRFAPSVVGLGLLFYASYNMLERIEGGSDFMAIGLLSFLISATVISWQLLISVGAERDGGSA